MALPYHAFSYILNSLVSLVTSSICLKLISGYNFPIALHLPQIPECDGRKTRGHAACSHVTFMTADHKGLLPHTLVNSPFLFPELLFYTFSLLHIQCLLPPLLLRCYPLFSFHRENKSKQRRTTSLPTTKHAHLSPPSPLFLGFTSLRLCTRDRLLSALCRTLLLQRSALSSPSPFFFAGAESFQTAYRHAVIFSIFERVSLITQPPYSYYPFFIMGKHLKRFALLFRLYPLLFPSSFN